MLPIVLGPNVLRRAYRGGEAIAELRGIPVEEAPGPEDWIGSTTHVWGRPGVGMSRLPDGTLLADAVARDPEAFLGPSRPETGLLLKLLDAGERLMVHCHPDREFARRHLGLRWGKTEAWIIAATRGERPRVWLGFREEVTRAQLDAWVEAQDASRMLAAMNEVVVAAGDVLFLPAGLPHAIGEGLLVVELQEPTDLSVWIEWPGGRVGALSDGDMGLGVSTALGAVDRSAWPPARLHTLARREHGLLPSAADPFFRAQLVVGGDELEPEFSLLVVVGGDGCLESDLGSVPIRRGATVLVPHAAGRTRLSGTVRVYRALGPAA